MDDLKKTTEQARNSSRWLEQEFTKGSRFIRLQRNNENLPISLIKIPKKLGKLKKAPKKFDYINISFWSADREASTFVQIAQFCHYMNENHATKSGSDHNDSIISETRPNVVTILTGDKLADKKESNLSFTGILNAATINFEQITAFYAKYKKKWGTTGIGNNRKGFKIQQWIIIIGGCSSSSPTNATQINGYILNILLLRIQNWRGRSRQAWMGPNQFKSGSTEISRQQKLEKINKVRREPAIQQ